jgi:branched-chain amino acid transport system ATP-binding protein
MAEEILIVKGLSKFFGGLRAVDGLDFSLAEGRIQAVIGPNGAGKTTLFNLLTGFILPSEGSFFFIGKKLNGLKPHQIVSLGIGRTFQNLEIFSNMSVLENVMVGRHCRTRAGILSSGLRFPRMRKEEKAIRDRAMEELIFLGLERRVSRPAGSLPLGEQKLLEIARALATDPKLLLLDEPAGGLNIRETARLGEIIHRIRERGITIMLVEHDMSLVMEISDEVMVMNFGKKIAEGPPRLIQRNPQVIAAYLGEEVNHA